MNEIIIAAVSLALGSVISIVVTRVYYRRGGFAWYVKDFELFDFKAFNVGNRIKLTADDRPINELRWSIIAFWNSGTIAHSAAAIAPADCLRISMHGQGFRQILKTDQSRGAVNAHLDEHDDGFAVSFDLIDEDDWVAAYIIYEVIDSEQAHRPELIGTLMNLPHGFKFLDLEDHFTEKLWNRRFLAVLMAVFPIVFSFGVWKLVSSMEKIESLSGTEIPGLKMLSWLGYGTIVLLGLAAISYWASRWMVTSTKVPKGLLKALPMKKTWWFSK